MVYHTCLQIQFQLIQTCCHTNIQHHTGQQIQFISIKCCTYGRISQKQKIKLFILVVHNKIDFYQRIYFGMFWRLLHLSFHYQLNLLMLCYLYNSQCNLKIMDLQYSKFNTFIEPRTLRTTF